MRCMRFADEVQQLKVALRHSQSELESERRSMRDLRAYYGDAFTSATPAAATQVRVSCLFNRVVTHTYTRI